MLAQQKTLARPRNLITDCSMAIDRQYQSLPPLQRIGKTVDQREVRPIHERRLNRWVYLLKQAFRITVTARYGDAIIEMQIATPAVIVKTIGHVRILLNFK